MWMSYASLPNRVRIPTIDGYDGTVNPDDICVPTSFKDTTFSQLTNST